MRGWLSSSLVLALATTIVGCGSEDPPASDPFGANPGVKRPVEIAAAGDFGVRPSGAATLRAMAAAEPDVHLALGDFGYAGEDSAELFCSLVAEQMGPEPRLQVVAGNHEEDSSEDGFLRDFAECLPDRIGVVGDYGREYYFDIGRLARVLMISPDLTIDGERYAYERTADGPDRHLAWVEDAIDDARSLGIEWVIVGMHKNCVSTGRYPCEVSEDLLDSLLARRVDLIMNGHEHSYQRSSQLAPSKRRCPRLVPGEYDPGCIVDAHAPHRQGRGTVILISGAAGAFENHYPIVEGDDEHDYFVKAMGANTEGKRHGFTLLSLEPGRLAGRFVGSTPGSFSDRFVIRSGGG